MKKNLSLFGALFLMISCSKCIECSYQTVDVHGTKGNVMMEPTCGNKEERDKAKEIFELEAAADTTKNTQVNCSAS